MFFPKNIFVVIFCVCRCFSLTFFWPPSFHFFFLCLSLVLFFLPCFLFLMSISGSCFLLLVCLLVVSRCSFVFFFSCLLPCFILNHSLRFVITLHLICCWKLVREVKGSKDKTMGVRGTLCHDIFCPVPFPASPSDLHRF